MIETIATIATAIVLIAIGAFLVAFLLLWWEARKG